MAERVMHYSYFVISFRKFIIKNEYKFIYCNCCFVTVVCNKNLKICSNFYYNCKA